MLVWISHYVDSSFHRFLLLFKDPNFKTVYFLKVSSYELVF